MSKWNKAMTIASLVCIAGDVYMMQYAPVFFGMCALLLTGSVLLRVFLSGDDNV